MEQNKKSPTRMRSPNYPNYSLGDCLTYLLKFYNKYGTNESHYEDAITQMGHSPTSSTAGRLLASMYSYGLLEDRGSGKNKFVRISRLAQEILLETDNSSRRIELLQKAALLDNSMHSIWEKWGSTLPAEDTIKKSLQLEMNYSPEGAKRFAGVITNTYQYAKLFESNTTSSDEPEETISNEFLNDSTKKEIPLSSSNRKTNLLLPGKNREILISVPADLTNEEFDLIFKWLELQKYGLVKKAVEKSENSQED
jgi:hypothetical protein